MVTMMMEAVDAIIILMLIFHFGGHVGCELLGGLQIPAAYAAVTLLKSRPACGC